MGAFLSRLLLLLAALLAPATMAVHAATMAAPPAVTAAAGDDDHGHHAAPDKPPPPATPMSGTHCAGENGAPSEGGGGSLECMLACLALPAVGQNTGERLQAPEPHPPLPLVSIRSGLGPEAETPPPRPA